MILLAGEKGYLQIGTPLSWHVTGHTASGLCAMAVQPPYVPMLTCIVCIVYRSKYVCIFIYPIQKITEIYNKITEMYKKITELEISSWNVLDLLRSEVAYIGSEPILP